MTMDLRSTPSYAAVKDDGLVILRSTPVYVAVPDLPQVQLRDVHGFVMERVIETVELRGVSALVLQPQIAPGMFALSGLEALRAAVSKECGVSVTDAVGAFQNPVAVTGAYNTNVDIKANPVGDYSGKVTIRYNRFSLRDDVLAGKNLSTLIGTANTVHGRLAAVNTAFGLKLETRDVVDYPIPNGQGYFPLEIAPTSYLYAPGTGVYIGDPGNDLGALIVVSDLNGFDSES